MLKFPKSRIYRPRQGWPRMKMFAFTLLLVAVLVAAWYFDDRINQWGPVSIQGQKLIIADGDSFAIGTRRLRLKGIDAPEYRQTCKDANGADWPCGRTARAALEKLLTQPGLACDAEAHDRYSRSLATCRTTQTTDIAAAQVTDGMAVSDEYYGSRSYGDEEDAARNAKRGVWQGAFALPKDYRAALRTNTQPAE
jgi:endonuclease YncB( thermonuclease family)